MRKLYGLLTMVLVLNCSPAFSQEPSLPASIEFARQFIPDLTSEDGSDNNGKEDFYVYTEVGISWGKVYMDYGIFRLYVYLTDDKGQRLTFDSIIHAVNHLSSFGWELANVYVTMSGNDGHISSTTHYLVKKKFSCFTPEERKIYDQYVKK